VKIACHYPIPRPPVPQLDAAVQDGMKLVSAMGGVVNFLYPGTRARKCVPRFFCGLHQLPYLRRLDQQVDLHHFFSNGLYLYPVLFFLKKPIVYTSVIEIGQKPPKISRMLKGRVSRIIVSSGRDLRILMANGLSCEFIPAGIDITKFSHAPMTATDRIVLLAGSAPWSEEQFKSKGILALLQTAAMFPWLHLKFLWRGKFIEKMHGLIGAHGLKERVSVVNREVNVNSMLASVHGAIVLAEKSALVKGYPHSLLEALAAGKPVIVSRCLAMADFVNEHRCGVCVERVEQHHVGESILELRKGYARLAREAASLDMRRFSDREMIASYQRVYQRVLERR